jgi:S1-C subfamily serine protease
MKLIHILLSLMLMGGCAHTVESTLSESRGSVVKLEYNSGICTSFHIGGGYFLTAAHCFHDAVLVSGVTVIDDRGERHRAALINRDSKRDIAILAVDDFHGPALKLWGPSDGAVKMGSETLTLGFPGYYGTDFIFEHSRVQDQLVLRDTRVFIAKEAAYKGQSGGPVISVANGKVLGLVRSCAEKVMDLETGAHVHNSLGIFVSYEELRRFISKSGIILQE